MQTKGPKTRTVTLCYERADPGVNRLSALKADADPIPNAFWHSVDVVAANAPPSDADATNYDSDAILDAPILTLGGDVSADERRSIRRNHFDHSSAQVGGIHLDSADYNRSDVDYCIAVGRRQG